MLVGIIWDSRSCTPLLKCITHFFTCIHLWMEMLVGWFSSFSYTLKMINITVNKSNYYFNLFFEISCLIFLTLFDIPYWVLYPCTKSFAYCQSFLVPKLLYYGVGYSRFDDAHNYAVYKSWHVGFFAQIDFRHSEFTALAFLYLCIRFSQKRTHFY